MWLTIRAVHIEVAHSLDTDSFLLALWRFIARWGQVEEIRSDNGTNFTSGEHELRESIQAWNHDKINEAMLQKTSNGAPIPLMVHITVVFGSSAYAQFEEFYALFSKNKRQMMKVLVLLCAR